MITIGLLVFFAQETGVKFFLDLKSLNVVKYAREKPAADAEKSAFHDIIKLRIFINLMWR